MVDDSGASLEAAIDDDPDDLAAYSVYADWLQRRGDPRGELIALGLAADAATAAAPAGKPRTQTSEQRALARFMTKHAGTLLGPLQRVVSDASRPPFEWRAGFIARAELVAAPLRPAAPIVRELLAHPSGRFLRALAIRTEDEGVEVITAVQHLAPGALRELELVTLDDLCRYAPRWDRLRRLHRLDLSARAIELGELALPALRRLRLAATELSGSCVRAVAKAPLAQLERLELEFGESGAYLATFDDLRPLLERTDLPALTHLRLKYAPFAGAIARALAASPVAGQLVVLDLSHGSFVPSDIEALEHARDRFANLRELWLPLARLRDQDRKRAQGLAPHVISDARSPKPRR